MEFGNNPSVDELLLAALRGNQRPAPAAPAEPPVGVVPRGQLTADILRRQGNELTPNAPLPNIPMNDVVQPVANRPTVQSLYDKLDIVNRKPLDYSGLEAINKSRAEGSKDDFLGGLALQMMGGKSIAPAGAHIFEQALKDREPIRPNAADIGWTDPRTGKVVENPMMARSQEEKLITGRIDSLIKEEETKARIALEKGQRELAAQHQRNLEVLMAQKTAAQITVINNKAVSDDQRAAAKGALKPLAETQRKALEQKVDAIQNLETAASTWDDSYAGSWGPLSRARVALASTAGGLAPKADEQRANWWKNFGMYQTLPMRHALFGSALTPTEQASWQAVQEITPGSSPETIKNAMTKLITLARDKHRRMQEQLASDKRDSSAYDLPADATIKPIRPAANTPAAGGLSVAEAAELAALKEKHGR